MANIDLKNLIDTIVGMARESLDLRKRNAEASWYGGNKDEEEYWKEMRRRNTELELRGAEGKNRLAEREMINTGELEKQRVADAGELARKQLDLDFDKYKLGRDIDVDIYKTETDRYLKQQELAGKGDNKAKEIEAITGALSLTDLPEQTRKALTGRLNSIYSETPAPEGGKPAPGAATPAASIEAIEKPAALNIIEGFTGANKPDYRGSGHYTPGPAASGSSLPSQNYQENAEKYLGYLAEPVGSLAFDALANRRPSPTATTEAPPAPATGLGGSIGRGLYSLTHPGPLEEPARSPRVESPARKAMDKFVFETAPTAIANTAKDAATGVYDFGQNIPRGYEEKKAEEARKKRKVLGNY